MIPIKLQPNAATLPRLLLTCHGCKHCWYSAPGGQPPLKPYPHSRCTALAADVPMILGEQDKWLGSEVPAGCPEHRQPELFA